MPSALYAVSRLDAFGSASPVALCKSLAEADALVDSLSAAVPKGVLEFYCREEVSAPAESFKAVKSAALALAFAE